MKSNSPDPCRRDDDDDEKLHGEEAHFDDEEFLYVGDVDEVIDAMEAANDEDEDQEAVADEELPDESALKFTGHSKAVFCGAIHPSGRWCASGGEDERAYVWDAESGETLVSCTEDFSDSVTICAFSFDGAYLALADMSGEVRARRCPPVGAWEVVWEYRATDLAWGSWHPAAHVFLAGASSGEVYAWKVPSGETKVLQGHGKPTSCGVVLKDGKRMAVGYDDGSIRIWDLKTANTVHHFPPTSEELTAVNAIDTFHDNNLVITGYLDGKIHLLKSAAGKLCGTLNVDGSVEVIKFSKDPALGLAAVGTLLGSISIWDVARQTMRNKCATDEDEDGETPGVTTLIWIDHFIVAGFLSGKVKVFDGKSGKHLKTLTGNSLEILDMQYCHATKALMTTSEDSACRIFKLDVNELAVN